MNWQDLLPAISEFFTNHQYLGVFTAGFIAFIESLAIVGSIIPGSIVMSIVGFLLGIAAIPLKATIISIFIGAFIGDYISYGLGAYYKDRITSHHWVQPYHHWLMHGEAFMRKHGALSIIIGRFFGPMRSIIPLIAGLANMNIVTFTLAIIPTIILWSIVYLTPGILLGAISIDMGESQFITITSWAFFTVLIFALWHSLHTLIRMIHPYLIRRYPQILDPTAITHIIKSLLYLAIAGAFFKQQLSAPGEGLLNLAGYHYSLTYTTPYTIHLAQLISFIANYSTFILINIALTVILYYHRHIKMAIIWSMSTAGLFLLTSILKYTVKMPRPHLDLPATGFPSGHILLFGTLLLWFSLLIETKSQNIGTSLRRLSMVGIILIGASRLIIQAHWMLDLLSSMALSLSLWHFASIWRMHIPKIPTPHLKQLGAAILLVILPLLTIFPRWDQKIEPQIPANITINSYKDLKKIPQLRRSRLGQITAPINFIWAGSTKDLQAYFTDMQWTQYPTDGSTLQRIATIFSFNEYQRILPFIPPLFERQPPALIFGTTIDQKGYIAKLWHLQGKVNTYVGTISLETYPESFFASSLFVCQKNRFNISTILPTKPHQIQHKEPYTRDESINAFCWDGEVLVIK